MFARKFVDPAFEGLAEAEVVAMQRQNLLAANGVKDPVRELDFDP